MLTSNQIITWQTIRTVLLGVVLCASIVSAQEALQFNVPYHCPDGTDNIVTRCQSNARGEVCFWREEKNGQLIVERYNIRSQMDGWLKVCKIQSAPSGKQVAAPSQPGQALNPSYLGEMPVPARITREIKGKDAEDTIERQMGAFQALMKMVDDLAWGLEHRYLPKRATPDENRIKEAYGQAYADLWHTAKNKEDHRYDHDRELLGELLTKLFSPSFRDLYAKSDANSEAYYKAYRAKMSGVLLSTGPAASPGAAASTGPTASLGSKSEVTPGSTAEMRRCVESGRSQRNCFSEVMSNGMDQLTGISLKLPSTPGLRMTGDYSGPGGFRLIFQPEKVTMVCRGVPAPRLYDVEMTDTQALVKIQNESKSAVFALRQDGKLAGSGPIRVTGQVPAGSHNEQTSGMTTQKTTRQRELTPLEAQNYPDAKRNGQVFTTTEDATELAYGPTGTRTVTDYVTKTADCSLGLMTPTGPTPLPPDIESPFGLITTIFSGASTLMNGGTTKDALKDMLNLDKAQPPGLRMGGKYTGQKGFSITFHPESATIACGDAERALEYSVQRTGNQTLLKIQDSTHPISLQLRPDGSLFGEGTVQVNGRVIVGTTEDPKNPFIFSPKIGRCEVGSLVAGGQR